MPGVAVAPAGVPKSVTEAPTAGAPLLRRTVTVTVEKLDPSASTDVGVAEMVESVGLIAFGFGATTVVGSLAVLLAVFVSPVVETVTVLVKEPATDGITVRSSSSVGPAASTALYVQVTVVVPEHVQPAPLAETSVIPAGSVSVSVIGAVVGPEPTFWTVIV